MPSDLESIWDILVCPYCKNPLLQTENGAKCPKCHEKYHYTNKRQLDLRIKKGKNINLNFELNKNLLRMENSVFFNFQGKNAPNINLDLESIPRRLTKELISYFPNPKNDKSIMLDLGCGDTVHKNLCECFGFKYVGLDIDSSKAPILGDAHALPFRDNSFEFILSVAVLEHIRYPFIVIKEIYRTLMSGGKLIGTVAFLEPFHGNSFYHYTCLGILNLLDFANFKIDFIIPNHEWMVLTAQAQMGLFPKIPSLISKSIITPLNLFHRLWWKIGHLIDHTDKSNEMHRLLSMTGSFFFSCRK